MISQLLGGKHGTLVLLSFAVHIYAHYHLSHN